MSQYDSMKESAASAETADETMNHDGSSEESLFKGILRDEKGVYYWISEQPMLKSLFLLTEVWKVFALAALIVALFCLVIFLSNGEGFSAVISAGQVMLITFGIIFVLSIPAYLIITWANNGLYTVLFEMDDNGISHTQIKTEKAAALEMLTIYIGSATKNPSTTAAGLLSASGGSLHSSFSGVRKIVADSHSNLIRLNGLLVRNQIYPPEEDFEIILGYILDHCPNAVVVLKQ